MPLDAWTCHRRGEDNNGGAIYCSSSSPIITHNTISGNSCNGYGGGIYCDNSNPLISSNTISGNSAQIAGGGIYCDNSNPLISSNTISGNSAQIAGGGIYCNHNSSPTISDNTINGNSGYMGGGIGYGNDSSPTISGNIIGGNSAEYSGGGIVCLGYPSPIISGNTIVGNSVNEGFGGGIGCSAESHPTIFNCILWGNGPQQINSSPAVAVTYCDIQDTLWPGMGNISLNPLFVDTTNGDYHLQSVIGSFHGGLWTPDLQQSPCIDAGDPSSPFGNEPLPNGDRINMGFEGNTAEASLSAPAWAPPPIADIPREFLLYSPHPNPFNATTILSYRLPLASHVGLKIYDTVGRLVMILVDGWRDVGAHQITFDGAGLPSGIYFAKLEAGDFSQVQKLVLMK